MTATACRQPPALDVERLREDFPILAERVRGKPLVYLDNAATSQKPRPSSTPSAAIYAAENANIHRGVHYLSERATVAYDGVRARVARFLNAASPGEIVFTRGTTEGINLVAQSWGRSTLKAGDEILITGMEHHSNIVPWQLLAAQTGATVRAVPITDAGELDLKAFDRLLTDRTRLLAVAHLSNALGTINPVRWMVVACARARHRDAGGRRPVGAAPAGGRPGARLRLLRVLGTQGLRARPASACSTARRRCSRRCLPGRGAAT